jgi:methanogenic corrinoid protein MtbC1
MLLGAMKVAQSATEKGPQIVSVEMQQSAEFAATVLEASAPGFAGMASSLLLERHPEFKAVWGEDASSRWKTHLQQRLLELAAAIRVGEPALFVSRVQWTARAFLAREAPLESVVRSLGCLRDILAERLPEPGRDIALSYLDQGTKGVGLAATAESSVLRGSGPETRLALRYLAAGLDGRTRAAEDLVLEAVDSGLDPRAAYLEVLLPAQVEVGRLWHDGEIGIAEERVLTGTTQRILPQLARRLQPAAERWLTAITAAVRGNTHDIAMRVVSDLLEADGWRTVFLGPDVPPEEVQRAAEYFDGRLVVLSAALTTQLGDLEETINALRGMPDNGPRIIVGGLALDGAPDLWRRLGADAYSASIDGLLDTAADLFPAK